MRFLLYKGIFHLPATPQLVGPYYNKPIQILALFLVFFFSGCLFGGKKETPSEVATVPQPVTMPKASSPPPPPTQATEKVKETQELPVERQELYDDLLSRLSSLERDYRFLKDKVSMLEFLMGEANKDSKKTKEEMHAELEKLRTQLSDYNTLMLRILDRVSKEPKKETSAAPH
ncbi:MAG TPA: hypothetical protein ACFYD3_00555 [Candidatus Hypogeohydataceae bacterium YC41]